MDPKDKEIADLKEKVNALNATVVTITGERDTAIKDRDAAKGEVTKLGADIKEKDKIIKQKSDDLVGARKQYKKLSDMTQEERDALTEKEIELAERTEKLEADGKAFQEKVAADAKKQVEARRDAILTKMAGAKPEIVAKLKENWAKIDKALTDKAITDEELTSIANDAYNMLGNLKPAAVSSAVNGSGSGEGAGDGKTDFTSTPDGVALAKSLGVDVGAEVKK